MDKTEKHMIRDFRPQWHFTPKRGWINDPNGLVYDGRQYHLFAQHNPADIHWGPMHWLHATSSDLISWEEQGIALYPDEELGTVFSGSAVMDVNNTSGLGDGKTPVMVILYTSHGAQQHQCVAYSNDGITFKKYAGNPVIANPGILDFRDPKVFWYEPQGYWVMMLAAKEQINFYRSDNLINWTQTGSFGRVENRLGYIFECPDLFPLTSPDGQQVWVLIASMILAEAHNECKMQYFLGQYDGSTFHCTSPHQEVLRVEEGYDAYAGISYNGTMDRLFISWLPNRSCESDLPTDGYCGCLTLPRLLTLVQSDQGLRLAGLPISLPWSHNNPMNDGDKLPGQLFSLLLCGEGPMEAVLENIQGEFLRLGVDQAGYIYTERSVTKAVHANALLNSDAYRRTCIPRKRQGKVTLELILDVSVAEVFADEGLYAHSLLLFPSAPLTHLRLTPNVKAICRLR